MEETRPANQKSDQLKFTLDMKCGASWDKIAKLSTTFNLPSFGRVRKRAELYGTYMWQMP